MLKKDVTGYCGMAETAVRNEKRCWQNAEKRALFNSGFLSTPL